MVRGVPKVRMFALVAPLSGSSHPTTGDVWVAGYTGQILVFQDR
jgi:hypothetical protein